MIIHFQHQGELFQVDLSRPIEISLPLTDDNTRVDAFHLPPLKKEPFIAGSFVGDVLQGGPCNVNTITFNPHGNGTHTETVGHISREKETVYDHVKRFWFTAELVSVDPALLFDDRVIMANQVEQALARHPEALIIRTRPNVEDKRHRNYSGSNPVYLHAEAARMIHDAGVQHLLIDVPSVDKEDDGGALAAHHAFWAYPEKTRKESTITELIYVPDEVKDGFYLLNLMVTSIMNDASPSRPILYKPFHLPGGSDRV